MRRLLVMAMLLGGAEPALAEVRPLPVPVVTLYPGDVLDAQRIGFKDFHLTADTPDRFAMTRAQLEGKTARRTLVAGKPIALAHVAGQRVVRKGVPAHAAWQKGALSIDLMVEPLDDGAAGDLIRARNSETGAELRVLVRADGTLVAAP